MEYRRLGNSGLQVSAIGLGTNTFGTDVDVPGVDRVISTLLDEGCNFIDTADSYPPGGAVGQSEEFIGKALKNGRRQQAIVATKFASKVGDGPNDTGTSRHHAMEALDNALRRLDTDYIDLLQVHRPDFNTPIEETMQALDDMVRAGKVRYVGCSNFAGWQIAASLGASRNEHLVPFVSLQSEYSLLQRGLERDVIPACRHFGVGVIPFFPLAGGFLTGKYRRGQEMPADTRGGKRPQSLRRWANDENYEIVEQLDAWATERGHTIAELAVAWLLAEPQVSSVICGVSRAEQVSMNAKAASWKLTSEQAKEVGELVSGPAQPARR